LYNGPSINTNRTNYRNFETFGLHAEAHAIINSYGKDLNYIPNMKNFHIKNNNIKKLDLLVIRVNNSGKLCNSRPCIYCLKMMKDVKIKRVYYINNDGDLVVELVKDMLSICTPSVSKDFYFLKTNIKLSRVEHQEEIIKHTFPDQVKKQSLLHLIEMNMDFKFILTKNNQGQHIVIIINSKNEEIKKSIII
jgi:hypothetical protein